tara:strand:+ start:7163 stop:7663 length:501 start_codon:yes stop_codon:yes gene_type:complete
MGSTFGCLEEKKEGQEGEDEDTFPCSPDNDQSKDDQLREEQKDDDEKERKRGAAYWEGDGKGEIIVSLYQSERSDFVGTYDEVMKHDLLLEQAEFNARTEAPEQNGVELLSPSMKDKQNDTQSPLMTPPPWKSAPKGYDAPSSELAAKLEARRKQHKQQQKQASVS